MDTQHQLKLKSKDKGKVYSFDSADGLNSKKSFRDEELLLVNEINTHQEDSLLIIQSNYGFLGTVLGDKTEEVKMQDTSARACKFSNKNAEQNGVSNSKVQNVSVPEVEGVFDKIIYAPADYEPVDLVKNRLSHAAEKLDEEGEIYLAGRSKSGIKRYKDYLEQHGELTKLGKRNQVRAYSFKPGSEPLPRKDLEKQHSAQIEDKKADFVSSEGLFSSGELDRGTRALLENISLPDSEKVLDLGCGYGTISVFLGKELDSKFYLTDDDVRATRYAEENMEKNNIADFEVSTSDCLDSFPDTKFNLIVSNPPTHQGSGVTGKMFRQAYSSLNEEGELWLVYNQNMHFENKLPDDFDSTEVIAQEYNFIVLKAVK